MSNDESPADRRYREWQERERNRKADEARNEEIRERIAYGMNDREARGRDQCLVLAVALAGAAGTIGVLVAKGVGVILRH